MADANAAQQIKSIRITRQIIRADGTRETPRLTGYIDRDPVEMERVLRDERPDGVINSGTGVLDTLNGVPEADAARICAMNEEQARCV